MFFDCHHCLCYDSVWWDEIFKPAVSCFERCFSLGAMGLSYEYMVAEGSSNSFVVIVGASLMLAVLVTGLTRLDRQSE